MVIIKQKKKKNFTLLIEYNEKKLAFGYFFTVKEMGNTIIVIYTKKINCMANIKFEKNKIQSNYKKK